MRGGAVLLVLCSALTAAAQSHYADAEEEMRLGEAYYQKGNYRGAVAHFSAARTLAPDKPGPYLWLGLSHYALGECGPAVAILEKYVALKGSDPRQEAIDALADCRPKIAPKPGKVRIDSTPPGATVQLDPPDGPVLGVTPLESTEVPNGSHKVLLTLDGYAPRQGDVHVTPNGLSMITLSLQRLGLPPPPPPPPIDRQIPPPQKRDNRGLVAGVVVGVLVLAGVGLGVGLGIGLGQPAEPPGDVLGPVRIP